MGEVSDPSLRGKSASRGSGKKPKHFLEKNDALELAASIAGVQEEKALHKAEKHHKAQLRVPKETPKPRMSAVRLKLKETKALLASQRAHAKKDKARKRKQVSQGVGTPGDGDHAGPSDSKPMEATRKRVSFA